VEWLSSDAVVSPEGEVVSWWSPDDCGYAYPEAGGLWLSFMAGEASSNPVVMSRADHVASWLAGIVRREGAVGRDDSLFLFDSAIVLDGLTAYRRTRGITDVEGTAHTLYAFISDCIRRREAMVPAYKGGGKHWSQSFGSHLLKVAISMHRFEQATGKPSSPEVMDTLLHSLLPLYRDGRFVDRPGSDVTYLHGSLYATEGLLYLDTCGLGDFSPILERSAEWLAGIQFPGGGFPAFVDPSGRHGEPRVDAAAQAVRVFSALDDPRYQSNTVMATHFMAELQSDGGGLFYSAGSRHINTWATLFAAQALSRMNGDALRRAIF